MASIYNNVIELENSGKAGALCTIIRTSGSTPRHEGSKLLYYDDGRILGSVGGGEVENRVIEEAKASIHGWENPVFALQNGGSWKRGSGSLWRAGGSVY